MHSNVPLFLLRWRLQGGVAIAILRVRFTEARLKSQGNQCVDVAMLKLALR
jgi:hypothetical protein